MDSPKGLALILANEKESTHEKNMKKLRNELYNTNEPINERKSYEIIESYKSFSDKNSKVIYSHYSKSNTDYAKLSKVKYLILCSIEGKKYVRFDVEKLLLTDNYKVKVRDGILEKYINPDFDDIDEPNMLLFLISNPKDLNQSDLEEYKPYEENLTSSLKDFISRGSQGSQYYLK